MCTKGVNHKPSGYQKNFTWIMAIPMNFILISLNLGIVFNQKCSLYLEERKNKIGATLLNSGFVVEDSQNFLNYKTYGFIGDRSS